MHQRIVNQGLAHKSTGGIPLSLPEPVDPVGNALTLNTVASRAAQLS